MPEGYDIDFTDIDAAVREIIDELGIPVRQAVNTIGLNLYADVTAFSPVLTGRYRASWNLNEQAPNLDTAATFSDQPPQGASLDPPSLSTRPAYPVLVLSNALPYATRIEDGYSTEKAPDGVLKRALASRNFGR